MTDSAEDGSGVTQCPECGAEMNRKGVSGTQKNGLPAAYSWDECTECGTIIHEDGSIATPEDQQKAMEEAGKYV